MAVGNGTQEVRGQGWDGAAGLGKNLPAAFACLAMELGAAGCIEIQQHKEGMNQPEGLWPAACKVCGGQPAQCPGLCLLSNLQTPRGPEVLYWGVLTKPEQN